MNLKAQRAAKYKAAMELIAKQKGGVDLSQDEVTQLQSLVDEVKALDVQIKAADEANASFEALANLDPAGAGVGTEQQKSAPTLGDHFVQHVKSRGSSLKTRGLTIAAPEYVKAATDTQTTPASLVTPVLTEVDRNFVMPYRQQPVIADLLSWGTISGTAITYPEFGTLEGGTGVVSEGGLKPQLHVTDPTWRTDALSEIAGWFKMTDDMAEDLPWLVSEINSTALYDLALKEEAQLLNGSGVSPNLQGILNRSGIQTETQGTSPDTAEEAIFRAIMKVQTATGFAADGIVINPADYQKLRLKRDGNQQFYGGGFFQGQYGNGALQWQPPLWGLRTIVTSAVPAKTVVVGAWRAGAKGYRKGGIRVESTNSNEDDFINDKITVRVRERIALAVRYPAAFVKVTLA